MTDKIESAEGTLDWAWAAVAAIIAALFMPIPIFR